MWLFLIVWGLASGYVPNSFRHTSTCGILWDDYDWILYNPASIPGIEGGRLYTNLSNLVSQEEHQFIPEGLGYFLCGLKAGPMALIGDYKELKVAEPTGIDELLGHGELADTSYSNIDPVTGEPDTIKITRDIKDAWARERDHNFMAGIGGSLSQNLKIGFSYLHSRDLDEAIRPEENYFHFETKIGSDTVQSVDSTTSVGSVKGYENYDQLQLGFLRTGKLFDLHLRLGFRYRSENPIRSEQKRFGWATDFVPDTVRSVTGLDFEATRPLSGWGLPIEILGIGRLDETKEVFFGLGGEYGRGSFSDAGMHQRSWDSTITDVVAVTLNSLSTQITGERSAYRAHLITKGLFSPQENLSFGLGLKLDLSSQTDWMSFHHFGQGQTILPDSKTSVDSTHQDSLHLRSTEWAISIPVGVEFRPISPLSFRLGGVFKHAVTNKTLDSLGVGVKQLRTIEEIGGAPPDTQIVYRDYSIPHYTETVKEVDNTTLYAFGLGYQVTENLQIDLMGFSKILDLTDWRISVILKF
jgi:hypothetical protein